MEIILTLLYVGNNLHKHYTIALALLTFSHMKTPYGQTFYSTLLPSACDIPVTLLDISYTISMSMSKVCISELEACHFCGP